MGHASFMYRCLELAERGRGRVGRNPMVGAVLACPERRRGARDNAVVAEGWHEEFGGPHAELCALRKVDQKNCSGCTLYVNLEPCCHYGKTPPCTECIIEKGVRTVVYGMRDPNPEVAGKGIAHLRAAGIEVVGPVLREECRRLNRGFCSLHEQGRPWVTLKMAQTRDGRIASDDGSPMKITSAEQDAWSHEYLRARHDAILVGVETVVRDDPRLTVRKLVPDATEGNAFQPWRIVLDPRLRIPLGATVVCDAHRGRTVVVTDMAVKDEKALKALEELRGRGVVVTEVPREGESFDFDALFSFSVGCGITSILVEGGRRTWESFRRAGRIDEEVILVGCAFPSTASQ